MWETFLRDSESVAQEAEAAYAVISGKETGDYLPEFDDAEKLGERGIPYKKSHPPKGLKSPEGPTERETLVKTRRVQSFFRATVLTSYENRCALTGLAIPEMLNASHIVPWSVDEKRRADPRNGICLNAFHDRAFDRGLITFDNNLTIILSPEIEKADNVSIQRDQLIGVAGHALRSPVRFKPDPRALDYHREHVFRG